MKQYWRVSEIRILASLGLGMLVIGKLYLDYVPVLRNWGLIGALTLGTFLFSVFLFLGWVYDTRIRMWSQKNQAIVERHVYYYVPMISTRAFEYPFLHSIISTLKGVSEKTGLKIKALEKIATYLNEYGDLQPSKSGIDRTIEMSGDFRKEHPFSDSISSTDDSISLSVKVKLWWEIQILRLTWIQSLTGLFQDVLIFGVLYVFVLFPFISEESALLYATLGISIPMLLALVALGWLYDKKLRIWSADLAVKVERNPYSYIAEPAQFSFTIPFFHALIEVYYKVLRKLNLDTTELERIIGFLNEYVRLQSTTNENLVAARKLRSSLGALFQEEKKIGN